MRRGRRGGRGREVLNAGREGGSDGGGGGGMEQDDIGGVRVCMRDGGGDESAEGEEERVEGVRP